MNLKKRKTRLIKVFGSLMDGEMGRKEYHHGGEAAAKIFADDRSTNSGSSDQTNRIQGCNMVLTSPNNKTNLAEGAKMFPVIENMNADTRLNGEHVNLGREVNDIFYGKKEGIKGSDLNMDSGHVQDLSFPAMEKVSTAAMGQNEIMLRKTELGIPLAVHDMGYSFSCLEDGADLDNGQNGNLLDKSTDGLHVIVPQIKENMVTINGRSGEVEKEVKAMMDLGNSLDIPNAYQFEEVVREATLEEIDDDSSSIGVRVKSKRKYTGKSKVHFGCRTFELQQGQQKIISNEG